MKKALKFAAIVRERNRIQLPIKNVRRIEKELGMPSMNNYLIVIEIKSIKSSQGVEFL